MSSPSDSQSSITVRLQNVALELRDIQQSLSKESSVDPAILSDFRDAVNRVRNTAWAVEQFANSKTSETDPESVLSLLAGERVRVSYQLCKLVENDLANSEIKFKKGQLLELRNALKLLGRQLDKTIRD